MGNKYALFNVLLDQARCRQLDGLVQEVIVRVTDRKLESGNLDVDGVHLECGGLGALRVDEVESSPCEASRVSKLEKETEAYTQRLHQAPHLPHPNP